MAILLKEIVPLLFESKDDWQALLLANWGLLVGSLQTRVRLEKILEDTLIIGVYESHWMQELYLLSDVLIDSINQFLKQPRIKRLRFKLVEEKKAASKKMMVTASKQPQRIMPILLTESQSNALDKIGDEQLKEALLGFWARCQIQQAGE